MSSANQFHRYYPDPTLQYPTQKDTIGDSDKKPHGSLCFLKNSPNRPPNISIGDFTYAESDCFWRDILSNTGINRLEIGKFCSIAERVVFCMGGNPNHNSQWISTYPFDSFKEGWNKSIQTFQPQADTLVGHDVWIGYGAFVMSGITIGDGAIIMPQSVVTKDVSPYSIVAGNPAHVTEQRFTDAEIEKLLSVQWWHWTYEFIASNLELILSGNVAALYDLHLNCESLGVRGSR